MAAIDFPASPATNQIFTAPNGTSYRWTGVLWTAAVRGMIVSDTAPVNVGPGQQWWNSVLGVLMIYFNDGNSSQWVPASAAGSNKLLQEVTVETGAMATGTTAIPFDDTIPQNTEGTEFMTLAITPQSATSKLIIEVVAQFTSALAGANTLIGALFQDANANALAANVTPGTQSVPAAITFRHVMTSGTTSATTFRFRAGLNGAATITFNGFTSARIFGGVMASSIVIREVTP